VATRTPRAPAQLEAYVLHRYDWSETSLIVELFTRELGRIVVAAKGAKRPHSQLRPVLLPLQRLHVALARSVGGGDAAASEVQTLRGAEWAGGPPMPGGATLFAGFYLNELLLKLLARHDPHPLLFDAYAASIAALSGRDDFVHEAALRAFELTLLRETGVLPELSVATQTQQPLHAGRAYRLVPEVGVVDAPGDDAPAVAGGVLLQLQAALDHGSTLALQQACATALPALKAQLRGLLHYHLGAAPLRTRSVMLDLQRLNDTPAAR
jgi:DNA repair protein RecO (recombination protein O)